jgi:hypothetical protein
LYGQTKKPPNRRVQQLKNLVPEALIPYYRKSRLKAHGFNRGMKGGVARCPLLRALRATCFVFIII